MLYIDQISPTRTRRKTKDVTFSSHYYFQKQGLFFPMALVYLLSFRKDRRCGGQRFVPVLPTSTRSLFRGEIRSQRQVNSIEPVSFYSLSLQTGNATSDSPRLLYRET